MSEWMDIARWPECVEMMKSGVVFEIRNAEGRTMLTPCVQPLPQMPFDWKSRPTQFRAVAERRPEHSSPMPEPKR
jgi:hypothetical protein